MMPARLHEESGFSLAELLVATALFVTVLGVAVGALHDLSDASDAAALSADLNVSLRSVANLITRDLLSAGRGIPVGGIAIPSGDAATALVRPSPAGNPLTFPLETTMPVVSTGSSLGPTVDGIATDMVSLLMLDPVLPEDGLPLSAVAADGSSVTVDAAQPLVDGPDEIRAGDLIMLTTAQGNTLQMVTARDGQVIEFATGDPMNLNQRDATQGTIIQLQTAPGEYPPMTAYRVLMVSYYVEARDGGRPPVLIRRINLGTEQIVGVGIDNLQLTYDLVDGTINPTNVPEPVAPNTPHQIRKANLAISGHSYRPWRRSHKYLRSSLSTQVSLRSLSFIDRYQ